MIKFNKTEALPSKYPLRLLLLLNTCKCATHVESNCTGNPLTFLLPLKMIHPLLARYLTGVHRDPGNFSFPWTVATRKRGFLLLLAEVERQYREFSKRTRALFPPPPPPRLSCPSTAWPSLLFHLLVTFLQREHYNNRDSTRDFSSPLLFFLFNCSRKLFRSVWSRLRFVEFHLSIFLIFYRRLQFLCWSFFFTSNYIYRTIKRLNSFVCLFVFSYVI